MKLLNRRESVEGIVAPIAGILERLTQYSQRHTAKGENHTHLAELHMDHAATAHAESNKALAAADKIKKAI
jgi:hypothetical protein